jgi:ATP-dependent Clp protease ATP-binding subunit ClpA
VIRLGRQRRGPAPVHLAPIVGELCAAAQNEAIEFRHDFIGTEHVLLALIARDDQAGHALRNLGLDVACVREDVRRIVGEGPTPDTIFDADALAAIGVDLDAVRARTEETFGEGSLERARRRRGRCGAAGFGVSPRLKEALQTARDAAPNGTDVTAVDVTRSLAQQRESVAARVLDAHEISPERLLAALGVGGRDASG